MSIRAEYGQVKLVAKRYRSPARVRRQLQVIKDLQLPTLPRRPRVPGMVWAVSVVRDELDVLPHTIAHLLNQGVDHILIADNHSHDGTREFLQRRSAEDCRLHVAYDRQRAHWQSEKMTALAHHAWRGGADWIVPFDADEFWFAKSVSLADQLRSSSDAILYATFHHMVPQGEIDNPFERTRFVIDAESSFPGKVAARAHRLLEIGPGNHFATRVGRRAHGLHIAHAQYRSPEQIARKVRQGHAAASATGEDLSWFSPHWQKGAGLSDHVIEEVWLNMRRGISDDRIDFVFKRPIHGLQPIGWESWDPDDELSLSS